MDKYDFFDASRIAAESGRRVRCGEKGEWFTCEYGRPLYNDAEIGSNFYPTIEQQKQKIWELEPAYPKEVEIGEGLTLKRGDDGFWLRFASSSGGAAVLDLPPDCGPVVSKVIREWAEDRFKNLAWLPSDRFKNLAWLPWERFSLPEMPDKQFDFFGLLDDRTICIGTWYPEVKNWVTSFSNTAKLKYYIPVTKIPKPEINND